MARKDEGGVEADVGSLYVPMTFTIESEKTIRVEERIAELERKMVELLAEKTV